MNRVIIIGSQGSGKTTIAEIIARGLIEHPNAQDSIKVLDDCGSAFTICEESNLLDRTKGRVELVEHIAIVNGDAIPAIDNPHGLETEDAGKWADVFLVTCLGNPAIPYDRGSLIGWFANAMGRGHENARQFHGTEFHGQFHKDAMRTAAGPEVFHYDGDKEESTRIDVEFLEDAIAYLKAASRIDRWKSRLFYGKDKDLPNFEELLRVDRSLEYIANPQLIHGILGVATEGAELVESLVKLMSGVEENADEEVISNIVEESGDVDWFQELIAEAIGSSVSESRRIVIDKLKRRYPEKFSSQDAIERKDEVPSDV